MRSFDYYIVVEHPELGKVRTIRGATAEEVEQKARAQTIARDEQYARKLEAAARQAKRQETERSKAKAREPTRD
ncbi:MAG: hypothetical protein RMK73_02485 [Geminicoccaceae bacterium]|nr:hypothetical protein [Geminicoccaceae bacterium]MCS7267734.1 hypothetical protein [Geminicoccaceae bacterium]MDW8340331.1 hypothetical protein [Geminicoccaceae bacterium]